MFENPRRGRQARNFTTNVPKLLDLKSSSEQIYSENWRWVPLWVAFIKPIINFGFNMTSSVILCSYDLPKNVDFWYYYLIVGVIEMFNFFNMNCAWWGGPINTELYVFPPILESLPRLFSSKLQHIWSFHQNVSPGFIDYGKPGCIIKPFSSRLSGQS